MLATMLVPHDGSALAERALLYATKLARATEARLILLRAALAHSLPGVDPGPAQYAVLERAESELAEVANRLRSNGVLVEPHVYYDEPASAILDAATSQRADLIVMSTHRRTTLGRWVYGSVADRVLRRTDVPMLLIPPCCEHTWPLARPLGRRLRILVPLDGSALAEEAFGPAGLLAEAFDAELLLLRVVEPRINQYSGGGWEIKFEKAEEVAMAESYLEETAGRMPTTNWAVRTRVGVGQAAPTITDVAAQEGADLIAMASHGRGGLPRLLIGSVAIGVLQRAKMPLLVTRPAVAPVAVRLSDATELEPAGPPVTVTLSQRERELVREAVELLLTSTEREEHLSQPLHDLLSKLEQPGAEVTTQLNPVGVSA